MRPEELRRSSVKIAFRMICEDDGRLVAEGWGTLVGYDYENGRAAPFPRRSPSGSAPRAPDRLPAAMEVERKFLLAERPDGLEDHPAQRLEQGYLAIDPAGAEVRVRRKDDKTLMTVKSGHRPRARRGGVRGRRRSASSGCGR